MPSTRPRTSWAPSADLSQIPACRALSRSVSRRIRAITSARAISTTERVLENGALKTATPRWAAARRSIWLVPMQKAPIARRSVACARTRSVVEIALAEGIALMRRLTDRDKALHAGIWDKSADGAHEVRGRVLGIGGYANIGTQLSVLAEALGMSVVFYDTAERLSLGNARRLTSMDELLKMADVVTLHVD